MATALAQPLASPRLGTPKRQLGLRSLFTNVFMGNSKTPAFRSCSPLLPPPAPALPTASLSFTFTI